MLKIAVAATVLLLVLCIPCATLTEAYEVDDGKKGLLFETSENLQQSDAERLFSENTRRGFAETALECMLIDPDNFDITEVTVSDLDVRKSVANKNNNNVNTVLQASKYEMSITFTATAISAGDYFAHLDKGNKDLGVLFNDNTVTVGDVLKIKTRLIIGIASIDKTAYRSNSEDNLFVIDSNSENISNISIDEASVQYTLSGKSEKTVTISASSKQHSDVSTLMDYGETDNSDVRSGTTVFINPKCPKSAFSYSIDYKDSDIEGSYSANIDAGDYLSLSDMSGTITTATIIEADIDTVEPLCYGGDARYALFTDAGDDSLKNDQNMRAFLESVGTLDDSYDDAADLIDDIEDKLKRDSNAVLIGLIGVFILAAAVGAIYVISSTRREEA